jgi:Flp pilus assembly protein TadD
MNQKMRGRIASMLLCVLSTWGWGLPQEQEFNRGEDVRRPQLKQVQGFRQYQRPVFLSGTIILEDGTKPPTPVRVELVCGGAVVQQVYTSSGMFTLEVGGGHNSQLPSLYPYGLLSEGQSIGPGQAASLNLGACELQAKLSGFQSDRIFLGHRRALENPDVGTIVLHRRAKARGTTISLNTLAAPKEAWNAYQKALKELGKKKINLLKMSTELEKAVKIYPEFAAAWHLLGEIHLKLQDETTARRAFEQALAADSNYANPYISLAMLELVEERWEQAAQLCHQALELDPQLIRAHYFNALANGFLGNVDVAEESILRVRESSQAQEYPAVHLILGWVESQKGNFQSAAAEYRSFLEAQPTALITEKLKKQLTQWKEQDLIQSPETSK